MGFTLKKASLVAMGITLAMVVGACGRKSDEPLVPVTYRLKWLFNISVVGDLYADVHGLFADQGLSVTIKPGGPERDAIKELELGHAQFGVASADQVIRAVSKGSPIRVIAQLFQVNPLQWIYRPGEHRFDAPWDLRGKIIGITFGGNDETIMRALFLKYGIEPDMLTLFSVRYDFTPFYQRKVHLWPIYRNAQAITIGDRLEKAGETVAFFDPNAYGIRFVANSVITTKQMIEAHPDTVRKFITALLKGWREALDPANGEKALATVARYDKDTPMAHLQQQLVVTRELMKPKPETIIGRIDTAAWKETESIMVAQKLIPKPIGVEKILRSYAR